MLVPKGITTIVGNCGPGEQIVLSLSRPVDFKVTKNTDNVTITEADTTKGETAGTLDAAPGVKKVVFNCCDPLGAGTVWEFSSNIWVAVVGSTLIFSI